MVEPSTRSHKEPVRNLGAAQSDKRYVLTLGTCGDGKSTFNNAWIGATENIAADKVTGITMSFQMHPSIKPELQNTFFIDSPGFNDANMALENWIQRYNNWIAEKKTPPLSLVVLLISYSARIRDETSQTLCTLLSCVEKLEAKNFTVIFNKCPSHYTKAKAIEFFEEAIKTLATSAQKSFFKLTEPQVLIVKLVDQEVVDQAAVEKSIGPQVRQFIAEKLKTIELANVIKQKPTNFEEIMDNAGEVQRANLIKQNKEIAKLTSSVQDLENLLKERDRIRDQERIDAQKREDGLRQLISKLQVYEIDFEILVCNDGTTATYTGYMQNKKRHGKGIMKWSNGDEYKSNWKDGVRYGKGTMKFANGDVYKGECGDDGKTNGFGTKKYHFGSVYKGEWKNNERHGKGTMKWCNGDVYKGEWKNDRRHGFGETTFENDQPFKNEGNWTDGKMDGMFDFWERESSFLGFGGGVKNYRREYVDGERYRPPSMDAADRDYMNVCLDGPLL